MADSRPNFVFFMPDSQRAESLACYGHPLVRTPAYDRLAREGVCFENCYAQYPVCGPSRCSMMSGWYPHNTGCRSNEFFLHPHQPSLLRYLKEAGYHVEWHGKNDLYSHDYFPLAVTRSNVPSPSRAGRRSVSVHGGERIAPKGEPGWRSFLCQPLEAEPEDLNDALTIEDAIAFLDERPADAQPFALYLPLQMPHPPYTAPRGYYDMYSPDDVPPLRPPDLPGKPAHHQLLRHYLELDQMPEEMYRQMNAIYLGMTSYSDWLLGQLLEALDRLELSGNTVVVAFSDHGDFSGDYGLDHKTWGGLEDVHLRVPFVWRGPGFTAGHRVAEPVELFDLMATSLELAGIDCRHPHFARSLTAQLNGAAGDPERAVFAEGGLPPISAHCRDQFYMDGQLLRETASFYHPQAVMSLEHPEVTVNATMIRVGDLKLVYRPGEVCELYDLAADPRELDNVYESPGYAEARARLERRLMEWLIQTSDTTPFERDARGTPRLDLS